MQFTTAYLVLVAVIKQNRVQLTKIFRQVNLYDFAFFRPLKSGALSSAICNNQKNLL